jgi:hypothetical protein
MPGGGVNDETRRLVEDEEIAVLVEDGERDLLRLRYRRFRGRNGDLEELAALEPECGPTGALVDEDPSSLEQCLDPRPAELGEAGGDGPVETLTPERRADGEPVNLATGGVAVWSGPHVLAAV